MRKIFCGLLIAIASLASVQAQGIEAPSEGKAVVYFTRLSSMGFAVNFKYFHEDKFIGLFAGKNYMRYEVDPGEHLFWVSAENKYFVTTELEAGGIYVVSVDVKMGFGSARVGLTPITSAKDKLFKKAKALINKKEAKTTSEDRINEENEKLKDFIAEKLEAYNTDWKQNKDFPHISADNAIAEEAFK